MWGKRESAFRWLRAHKVIEIRIFAIQKTLNHIQIRNIILREVAQNLKRIPIVVLIPPAKTTEQPMMMNHQVGLCA